MTADTDQVISEGYTRKRHWEVVYHDLIDLYGAMIGLDGIALWVVYKRYVQHDPRHLLSDLAWPSHRSLAHTMYDCGRNRLHAVRSRLEEAGLITVTKGYHLGVSLPEIARLGVQNPANTLFIEVNDPLKFRAFCEEFELDYRPVYQSGRWQMAFTNYGGRIIGGNRLLAAVAYINEHPDKVTETQIRSLLRCSPDDRQTIAVRNHLIDHHRSPYRRAAPRSTNLPDDLLGGLKHLGWQGKLDEIEVAFAEDSTFVYAQLNYWLEHRDSVDNPAAAFLESVRYSPRDAMPGGLEELDF